jgi:hypothetical protein
MRPGARGQFQRLERLNQLLPYSVVLCAMCPDAEAVRGWHALNRSTVCTGARLRTGLSFYA